jgi:hypothetical protein
MKAWASAGDGQGLNAPREESNNEPWAAAVWAGSKGVVS